MNRSSTQALFAIVSLASSVPLTAFGQSTALLATYEGADRDERLAGARPVR